MLQPRFVLSTHSSLRRRQHRRVLVIRRPGTVKTRPIGPDSALRVERLSLEGQRSTHDRHDQAFAVTQLRGFHKEYMPCKELFFLTN